MDKYVLLDAQTLVYDKKDISRYVSESIMNIYGIITEVNLNNYSDFTSKETATQILKENGLKEEEIIPRLDRYLEDLPYSYYNVAWSDELYLMDGSKQLIDYMKKSKIEISSVSLEPTKIIDMRFKKVGIENYFLYKFG
ncbi:MAG: HAD hydrolase-like protein, partial [Candidatus Micrarchaeaceae archaeon]